MSWDERAACREPGVDPDVWYPDRSDKKGILYAKGFCIKCPVRRECGAAALEADEKFGVRGGYYLETEQRALRKYLDTATEPARRCLDCGSGLPDSRRGVQRCGACIRGLADATRAHEQARRLRAAGWTWARIAEEAGLEYETVRCILQRKRITMATERALLSIGTPAGVAS